MIRLNDVQRRLAADNIALVPVALQKYGRMGLEYDDAFQIAAMGLMRAAAHYDEARGVKFSTYAVRCIARTTCPVRPIPIKPEYQLYTHQVKSYNIALALMGYDQKGGKTDDPT